MTDSDWRQIMDEFHSLPENERTCGRVLEKLEERGVDINPQRVSDVLAATVAAELISYEDIQVTAKVLKVMVDFADPRWGSSEFFDGFVSRLASPLAVHPDVGGHQRSICRSLAAMAGMCSYGEEIDSYLSYLERVVFSVIDKTDDERL
jgi:hypothetical protein